MIWVLVGKKIDEMLAIQFRELQSSFGSEGEKNHKKGGLNCVFGNFFFYVLKNCSQVQSLK